MEINLSCGAVAEIDNEDFEKIKGHTWRLNSRGYIVTWLRVDKKKKAVLMHRLIMGVDKEPVVVDHVDHNKLNNRKSNLRICSNAENLRNRVVSKNNKLGAKGIYKVNNKFRVRIVANKTNYNLGSFESLEEAKIVYWEAAKKLHGTFAYAGAK